MPCLLHGGRRACAAPRHEVWDTDMHAPGCSPAQALPAQGQPGALEAQAGARCWRGSPQADRGDAASSDPVPATQRVTHLFCFSHVCNGDAHAILQPGERALA